MLLRKRTPIVATWFVCAAAWPLAFGETTGRPAGRTATATERLDFHREVQLLLSQRCFRCHGRDEQHREAGLRLDVRDAATAEAESGAIAVVPGDPDASELYVRITSHDDDLRMPPADSGPRLNGEEISRLQKWITDGAPYAEHWSFVPPRRWPLPSLGTTDGARNAIDFFVRARLEEEGLAAAETASRHALIRRLSLDLRGLPPSLAEIESFLRDERPMAYERLVERFLHDPAYGERWARLWLDLARYADSRGYGSDPLRKNMWRYRDWVIDAFNDNQPYDQFTLEQLAGDLLPQATLSQKMATAFHRNTMTNTEGGTDDEEFRVAAVKDRIETTAQVWMGLTLQCANCHDHKYDPISQQDYYRLFAVFNQTADSDLPDESPTIAAPLPWMEKSIAELDQRINELKQLVDRQRKRAAAGDTAKRALIAGPFVGTEISAEQKPLQQEVAGAPGPTGEFKPPARTTTEVAIGRLEREIERLEKTKPEIPTLPVMQQLPPDKRRESYLMVKGDFLSRGERVVPGLPARFATGGPAEPTRRDVARWLVDADNPLTARVAVNRIWAQLFGTGLVVTEEDFGTQGELPSHPQLLDWLATEYIGLGWDTKELLKLIVTSATYRQSSRLSAPQREADPSNRLLARGPRFRLDAETLRDQALELAGLLSRKLHGSSVFPYQPAGLWRAAFNGERTWPTSEGEDRFRRGLYTFWRRTVPYPSLQTFDAPSRELCTMRRIRTNTPLQAFVTLNDPVYVEAARGLAHRILREGGSTDGERVRYALRLTLARPAQEKQVAVLLRLLASERAHFCSQPAAAGQVAGDAQGEVNPPELAAWTVLASVLLNLDGVLTKG